VVLAKNIKNVARNRGIMSKEDDFEHEMILADVLLRLKTLENLLIAKGSFTQEEYLEEMGKVAQQLAQSLIEKAQAGGQKGMEELISSIKNEGN